MPADTRVRLYLTATDQASPKLRVVASTLNNIKAIAAGYVLAAAFMRLSSGLRQIAADAMNAAASLQTFTIGVETLIAREAVLAGKFETVSAALRGTGGNVESLNAQLRELSLTSMAVFPVDTIQSVWRLNMAYGATTQQSIDLTKAILSTSAALGLSSEMVQRLNYNLAQALVAGDLTQINLRQLKLAGLDLARVLYDELGLSLQQVRDQLKSGAITLKEVSEAFVKYADENFGTAAERMKGTLRGVQQAITNLFYWAGVDLLTPSIEAVSGALNELFEGARGLLDSGVFAYIGDELGKLTEKAADASIGFIKGFARGFRELPAKVAGPLKEVLFIMHNYGKEYADAAAQAGQDFSNSLGYKLGQVARDAFRYGFIISSELAAGLIEGAVAAIVAAMNFIASLLEWWLSPGSAPRIAPDIDKWGAAMFTTWLGGFQDAEWGIFDSVARRLESVFSTLLRIEAIDEKTFGTELIAYTKDLAKALDQFAKTGTIAVGIYDKLREIGGEFGKQLASLLEKQVNLAKATEEYNRITKAFEAAADASKKAREELERLTSEYEELVATRAPKILVRQKKAEMDAASARHSAAEKEKTDLEKQRDLAQERVNALKDQAKWQEKLIDQLQRMYQWQRKIDEAVDKAIEKAKKKVKKPKLPKGAKGKAEEGMPEYGIPDITPIAAGAEKSFGKIKDMLKDLIPPEFYDNIQRIQDAFDKLEDPWKRLKTVIGEVAEKKLGPFADDVEGLFPKQTRDNILRAAGAIGTFVAALGIARLAIKIGGFLLGFLGGKFLLVAVGLGLLYTAWEEDWQGMRTALTEFWEEHAKPKLDDLIAKLEVGIPNAVAKAEKAWADFVAWTELPGDERPGIETWWGDLEEKIAEHNKRMREKPDKTWLEQAQQDFQGFVAGIRDWLGDPERAGLETWIDNLLEPLDEKIRGWSNSTGEKIQTWSDEQARKIQGWADAAGFSIGLFVTISKGVISDLVTKTGEKISTWSTNATSDIQTWSDNAVEKFNEMGENVQTWFEEKIPLAWQAVVDFYDEHLSDTFETLTNFINVDLVPAAEDIVYWFEEKIKGAWQTIVDFWNDHLKKPLNELEDLLGGPKDSILQALKDVYDWTYNKLMEAWQKVENAWNGTFGNVWRAIHEMFGGIKGAIEGAVTAIKNLIDLIPKIPSINLPSLPFGLGGGQFGGYMAGGGLAMLHANEMVLPLGNQIGINALARAMKKAMGHGVAMGGSGTVYINTVNVYTDDAEDLLGQLQSLAIPGRAP